MVFNSGDTEFIAEEIEVKQDKERQKKEYNTSSIRNVALTSLRYGIGARPTAALTTAAWIDAGLITKENTKLVVDHNKVVRAQQKVMEELQQELDNMARNGNIECILFDGRKDLTKTMFKVEGTDQQYPGVIKEEHYSVCMEPGGNYLFHFTPEKATKNTKAAEVIANHLVAWMKERGVDISIKAIGGDSTNVNTGWAGGAIHWVEQKIGRKLVWLICLLHCNELPLCHLIIGLDRATLSDSKWEGPLGKMLDSVTELEINPKFKKVTLSPDLLTLSDKVVSDLSTDQAYGYRMVKAIRSGTCLSKTYSYTLARKMITFEKFRLLNSFFF